MPELTGSIEPLRREPEEVILVDGGSVDRTVSLARAWCQGRARTQVLEAGPATPGRGRNVGAKAARGEWLAFTDAGIRLEPDWLEQLTAVVERDGDVDVVYGNFEPVQDTWFEKCAALTYVPPKVERGNGRARGPSTASMLLRKSVWEVVGGFPDLRAAEDLIFMERIERAGFKIAWAPKATVWWQLQPNLWRTFKRFANYSKHNVWAGRQRYWHYGVLRIYLVFAVLVMLAMFLSPWFWGLVLAAGLARVFKSIWTRREGRGLFWALNPIQFAGVAVVMLTIDLATFAGWIRAMLSKPPQREPVQEQTIYERGSGVAGGPAAAATQSL